MTRRSLLGRLLSAACVKLRIAPAPKTWTFEHPGNPFYKTERVIGTLSDNALHAMPGIVAREALPMLESNLCFARLVNHRYGPSEPARISDYRVKVEPLPEPRETEGWPEPYEPEEDEDEEW